MVEAFYVVLRGLTVAVALWLMWECIRSARRSREVLTDKGRYTHFVWVGWGLVCAYGLSEQIVHDAPPGFRTFGTLVVLLASIYVVRMPGGSRYEPNSLRD